MAITLTFNPLTGNFDAVLVATANVQAWMATPSSANLRAAVTDETGSGALVFGTSPTIASPTFSGTIDGGSGIAVFANGMFRMKSASGGSVSTQSTAVFQWASGTDSNSGPFDVVLKRSAAAVFAIEGASGAGGAMQFTEMTAPSAGASNTVRLYAEDNGAGKTRLMALFSTGAAQQVAIEP